MSHLKNGKRKKKGGAQIDDDDGDNEKQQVSTPFVVYHRCHILYKQFTLSHCALVAFCSLAEDACSIQVQHNVLFAVLLPVCLLTAWYQQNLNFHPHNTNFEVTTPVCI